MALMVCPDCGNSVSDTAEQCIHCGCDLFLYQEEIRIDREIEKKVAEYERGIKKPEQITSLSQIPKYRNEGNANMLFLMMAIIAFCVAFLCIISDMDVFYWVMALVAGVFILAGYFYSVRNSQKLLKEEQSRRQNIIDNFEEIKEIRVRQHREILIAEKQRKLEKIKNRTVQTKVDRPTGLCCPACGSIRYEKISTLNRVVSVELAGLASSKIGKQYKCKKCGHLW